MKRKIAIFTGNRADYGLLHPIIKKISENKKMSYDLIVSGSHTNTSFGNTIKEIVKDKFKIKKKIQFNIKETGLPETIVKLIGLNIIETSKAIKEIKPDIFLVYGDRFETFAATIAATQNNIPTAHIEGGDITEGGALDDSVRHAITKLAHIHFATNSNAANRIITMGEERWRVKTVGLPSIDLIKQRKYASALTIKKELNLDLSKPILIFTQHSVSTEHSKALKQIKPSLLAIEKLHKLNIQIIITYPNNDAGGLKIIDAINQWKKKIKNKVQIRKSLGRFLFHGLLNLSRKNFKIVCAGNSSGGIKETPIFMCPNVNIGSRQNKRLKGINTIDVPYNATKIYKAIEKCFFDQDFRKKIKKTRNPYGNGNASQKIIKTLSEIKINKKLLQKKMTIK